MSDKIDKTTKPIKIIVRGGVVDVVKNVPDGIEYQIIDLDNREEEVAERQDLVDNAIFGMLRKVSIAEIKWDIETIGNIRDVVIDELVKKFGAKSEDLYPSFEDELS